MEHSLCLAFASIYVTFKHDLDNNNGKKIICNLWSFHERLKKTDRGIGIAPLSNITFNPPSIRRRTVFFFGGGQK